ncbi:hypothetical protein [Xanthobacter sp. YC-JY1]|uniref:hypothetical protein n=1 Tax=Xanthobacter sp. YC-JY1 TaxID=2419844 RepID=UPI001F437664|nr:hypothetical protein [Xanthobacter sp. YC-JY1]UJX45964.1 hypothetical protein D7006_15455 [Xanthobacter sp. YC-JY1]
MRNLTFSAVALAALLASGAAFAGDEASLAAADAEAQAAAAAHSQAQPLGYATQRAVPPAFVALSAGQERSPLSEADRLFLAQGDRGLGTN